MADLDKNKAATRQEVPFRVSLRGILDAYTRIAHDTPVRLYQGLARRVDTATQYMMTGPAALVTMPLGIVVRNGVRVAHEAVDRGGYAMGARAAGIAGAAGAWWLLGAAAYGATVATLGPIAAVIAAAVVTVPVVVPAFTAGTLAGATLLGAAAGAVSTLGAAMNLKVALLRSLDAFRGVKYDDATLKAMRGTLDENALQTVNEAKKLNAALHSVSRLNAEGRRKVYAELTEEFGSAAAGLAMAPEAAAAQPAPRAAQNNGPQPH